MLGKPSKSFHHLIAFVICYKGIESTESGLFCSGGYLLAYLYVFLALQMGIDVSAHIHAYLYYFEGKSLHTMILKFHFSTRMWTT